MNEKRTNGIIGLTVKSVKWLPKIGNTVIIYLFKCLWVGHTSVSGIRFPLTNVLRF